MAASALGAGRGIPQAQSILMGANRDEAAKPRISFVEDEAVLRDHLALETLHVL